MLVRTDFPWVAGRPRTREPRVDPLQDGYDARAAKYGTLARLVPKETPFTGPQHLEPRGRGAQGGGQSLIKDYLTGKNVA